MTKARRAGLFTILICSAISIWWGCSLGWSMPGGPLDFQAVYYGSKTLMQHHDPYRMDEVEAVFKAEGRETPNITPKQRTLITLFVNTPATLLFVAPFALLPLPLAQVLWLMLVSGSLILAAFLVWDLAIGRAPFVSACLVGFLILNCQVVFAAGNTAAIVVGLCIIGAWCFLKNQYVVIGIVCMALSLVIKPHDSGIVWLYFVLAGSVYRKRALQTAALAALFAAVSILWMSIVVPNWWRDWQANLAIISARGGMNDPRPAIVAGVSAGNVISLQAVFSVFSQNGRFFNLGSYLVCGALLLVWLAVTLRSSFSTERAWLALAACVPFTLLITYHRVYDAKLLLLTVPACALLWARRDMIGKNALILTSLAIILNADVPLAVLNNVTDHLHLDIATLSGRLLTVFLARPNQEILFVSGVFYLWVYWQTAKVEYRNHIGKCAAQSPERSQAESGNKKTEICEMALRKLRSKIESILNIAGYDHAISSIWPSQIEQLIVDDARSLQGVRE